MLIITTLEGTTQVYEDKLSSFFLELISINSLRLSAMSNCDEVYITCIACSQQNGLYVGPGMIFFHFFSVDDML